MKVVRTFVLALAFVVIAALTASAQTVQKITWDQNDPITSIVNNGDTFVLTVDTAAPAALTTTCAANPTDSTKSKCSAPMPTLSVGPHQSFVVTATNLAGSKASAPLLIVAPSSPTNLILQINVTVIVGTP